MTKKISLSSNDTDDKETIASVQAQCAEYAAIFDLMGKISSYSNKRDVIEKVKEIFFMIFGAQQFKYWSTDDSTDALPQEIKELLLDKEQEFLLSKEENRFCIKIMWHEQLFGVIDVSGFMFPIYIEKYLNFALEIAKICGLVFLNNEQYEKLLKSEQDFRYMSTHDSLTDLFNRTYINEIFDHQTLTTPFTVFMFDIDRLKFVNDHYGHAQGDKLIKSMALILKKSFRESDTIARIGGDEFIAILQGANRKRVDLIIRRIKEQSQVHNRNQQKDYLKLNFSIGYAIGKKQENSIESIMHIADEQMYKDKSSKRTLEIM